jgi:hypothetical protein
MEGKNQNLTMDEHQLNGYENREEPFTREDTEVHRESDRFTKSVLREGTTIYRYFVTTDGVVQCPRPLPTKI